jgi:cysteine sulfinate desulfinase/cysteine desulfurase-like protein
VLQAANNETGVIQPVAKSAPSVRRVAFPFSSTRCKPRGKMPFDRDGWQADLVAISGHKLGGPAGTGALHRQRRGGDGATDRRAVPKSDAAAEARRPWRARRIRSSV